MASTSSRYLSSNKLASFLRRGTRRRVPVKYCLVAGHYLAPRRLESEDNYDYLERIGFWHDDHYCEDGYGWQNAADAGWPHADFLGGDIFHGFVDAHASFFWGQAPDPRECHAATLCVRRPEVEREATSSHHEGHRVRHRH